MASASNKIMEIVIVLDVSKSMLRTDFGKMPLDILNDQLRIFIDALKDVPSIRERAELSIITYTETVQELVKYESLDDISTVPQLHSRDGLTLTAKAVDYAINLLEERIKTAGRFKQITPSVLVLITDGDPDQNEDTYYRNEIIRKLNEHTLSTNSENQILPFIIGVGNLSKNTQQILSSYSKGFIDGFFYIKDNIDTEDRFKELFQCISGSIRSEISGSSSRKYISTCNECSEFEEVPVAHRILDKLNSLLYEYPDIIRRL